MLCACSPIVKESYTGMEKEHKVLWGRFAIIKDDDNRCLITYDINTRVMYYFINRANESISPYYVRNGETVEIGVYGVNYFE
jgi:hypothetical protein